jgi:hypothetical protein
MSTTDRRPPDPLVRSFALLGPGLVTAASDDDPSVGTALTAVAVFATSR